MRFVATGCLRTKSRFATATQQKYCDHGLSVVVLTTTCPIRFALSSCGSGGNAMNASMSPLANIAMASGTGRVTQSMSRPGSSPTCFTMEARKMCRPEPSALTATFLPFRSRSDRTRSLPNSSKHPTWIPARMTSGSSASSCVMIAGAAATVRSASPFAMARLDSTPLAVFTGRTSVKPSARSNACATIRGAPEQISPCSMRRILVVSGPGSAPSVASKPPRAAVIAPAKPPRNARRFHRIASSVERAPVVRSSDPVIIPSALWSLVPETLSSSQDGWTRCGST
jgi:hypothetical protein